MADALSLLQFDLMCTAVQHAATMVAHTRVSLGAALDAACRRNGITLEDDTYAVAILALSKYRERVAQRATIAHLEAVARQHQEPCKPHKTGGGK